MGQKVSPHGMRVGVIKDWNSKWFADKNGFADLLIEDKKIREYVKKKLYVAGISKVLIAREGEDNLTVTILTSKPGMVIGRSGAGIEELKAGLVKLTGKEAGKLHISVEEVGRAELDAQLTAESVAEALERRIAFRRAMKQAIGNTMRANAKGIKILCSGRLGGAEIARSEKYSEGNVPLHTLRADIDYGKIGVKVWINHGEILDKGLQSPVREAKKDNRKERRQRKDGDRRRNDRRRNDRGGDRFGKKDVAKAVNKRIRPVAKAEEPKTEVAAPSEETNLPTEE